MSSGTMEVAAGDSLTGGQGNVGFSGTPMWKVSQQVQEAKQKRMEAVMAQQEAKHLPKESEPRPPALSAHGVSVGGDSVNGKPLSRHVVVKDLRKAAKLLKKELPNEGLLSSSSPLGLFALFDGQSCAGQVGPDAAEYCARQFHNRLLQRLSVLTTCTEASIGQAFAAAFADLEAEILSEGKVQDGCGAAVAFTVGQKLFTGVIGKCDAVLAQLKEENSTAQAAAISLGGKQGKPSLAEENAWIVQNGGKVAQNAGVTCIANADDSAFSPVSRCLGDAAWKLATPTPLIRAVPQINCTDLWWGRRHPFLLLVGAPVADHLSMSELMKTAAEFPLRPKAFGGEIAVKASALAKSSQCTVCSIGFLQTEENIGPAMPAAKKQKTGAPSTSVRLRHILVKHKECSNPVDPVRNKTVTRTKLEAEAILRKVLRDLREAGEDVLDPAKPEKVTPKFQKICREVSECETSKKGGATLGDLGWLNKDALKLYGQAFEETANTVPKAQWSDITSSDHGLHLILRML